ncbi:UNKNOWN [Stylonychia lemnae]|uniref:Uncharacterized protein n=1 Tax=Stylonychia lemnae TaxID=5949 RepID=A0A078AC99_STYLE|nr:UNKNOWN [Stylonychia lemnae]|eukprot:CDW78433.1 UNKNOWN [Stylonychia lemnae]
MIQSQKPKNQSIVISQVKVEDFQNQELPVQQQGQQYESLTKDEDLEIGEIPSENTVKDDTYIGSVLNVNFRVNVQDKKVNFLSPEQQKPIKTSYNDLFMKTQYLDQNHNYSQYNTTNQKSQQTSYNMINMSDISNGKQSFRTRNVERMAGNQNHRSLNLKNRQSPYLQNGKKSSNKTSINYRPPIRLDSQGSMQTSP